MVTIPGTPTASTADDTGRFAGDAARRPLSLTVTADELDALARRLGAARFPGVAGSVFDAIGAEHHGLLAERLLAALVARGLVAERDGELVADPGVATLLAPTLHGPIRYEIERTEPDGRHTTALGVAGDTVVWQRAEGVYHRFELVGTDGDPAAALAALVDAAPGEPAPAARVFRRRRSRLAAAGERPQGVPAAFAALAGDWRATTVITQVGAAAGAGTAALSWLAVIDGGPGRVWLVEPDPTSPDDGPLDGDDPLCRVTPTDPAALRHHLSAWCGQTA